MTQIQTPIRRAGKDYTVVTEAEKLPHFEHAALGEGQQPYRDVIKNIHIEADTKTGQIIRISTQYVRQMLSADGTLVLKESEFPRMVQNVQDIAFFISTYLPSFEKNMVNGYIRADEARGGLGCNHQPAFAQDGSPIADTAYNTEAAPSNNYSTHHSDGTSLDGVIENNADPSAWMAPQV